ncbi:hypothetical protein [Methanobrevibacter sp. DSM 116169]|uniref:hypothetical protein n=1 Tax=Methanobrevibacter sp. DSM 116169 TaxID=3242727 RepID=UPI0038FBF260
MNEKNNQNEIKADNINYAIYKIGNWENNYKINQIGLSNEIPLTKSTCEHVKMSMNEIRMAEFEIDSEKVNGFVAISYATNPEIQKMPIKDVTELEENEFNTITKEIDNLDLLDDNESVKLDGEDYLIYKLEKDCHVTKSEPANEFTLNHHKKELENFENSLKNK